MTKGLGRFEYYLIQLDDLLLKASRSENAALYLYENDARTKFFMLQGLARLYASFHNKKRFTLHKDLYKQIEDALGAIDYFDSYAKALLDDASMPVSLRIYMEEKKAEQVAILNAILIKRKWINHDPLRTKKIRKKLKTAKWLKPQNELVLLHQFYKDAISEINSFYKETGETFTDIELQVHSLRRKLRWLSIYPQAMQGAIQLVKTKSTDASVKKYLTQKIVKSPYNKLPLPGNNPQVLQLDEQYFFALSFVIAALGDLKDEGLKVVAIADAIHHTQAVDQNIALKRAYKLCKMPNNNLQNIMNNAKTLCSAYFEGQYLEKLVIGVATIA